MSFVALCDVIIETLARGVCNRRLGSLLIKKF